MDWATFIHNYGIYGVLLYLVAKDSGPLLGKILPKYFARKQQAEIEDKAEERKFQHQLISNLEKALAGIDNSMKNQTRIMAHMSGRLDSTKSSLDKYTARGYNAMEEIAILADRPRQKKRITKSK